MRSFGWKGSWTWMNEWIKYEGDWRTAPATPGLFIKVFGYSVLQTNFYSFLGAVNKICQLTLADNGGRSVRKMWHLKDIDEKNPEYFLSEALKVTILRKVSRFLAFSIKWQSLLHSKMNLDVYKTLWGFFQTIRESHASYITQTVQSSAMQCSAKQCGAVQCSAKQWIIVQYTKGQFNSCKNSELQWSAVQCCLCVGSTV